MKIHFIHIGKTGGTSIIHALRQYRGKKYVFILHPHQTVLSDIPIGEKYFFSVRDPVTRFQSAFYSRQRQGKPKYDVKWSKSEAKCYKWYSTPEKLALDLSSLLLWKRRRAKFAMRSIMHIKSGFWNWFINDEYFLSRREDLIGVLRQENLSEDFDKLKQILSIKDKNVMLPRNKVDAFKNPADISYMMSTKAIRNLKRWYSKDYEFLEVANRLK